MAADTALDLKAAHQAHGPAPYTWLGFILVLLASEAAMAWAIGARNFWLIVPLTLVLAHLMHAQVLAFHEAAHGLISSNRFWNDAIGIAIGSVGFMGLSAFRALHRTHHDYLATERDEELWPFVQPRASRGFRRVAAVLELSFGLLFTTALGLRTAFRAGSPVRGTGKRVRIVAEYLLDISVWVGAAVIATRTGTWPYLIGMLVVPTVLAGNLHSFRKYIEHMGLTGNTVLSSTRSIVPDTMLGRIVAFSMFNIQYHGVHHRYAKIPQARLPGLTSLLAPGAPGELTPYRSYRRAMLDMFKTLSDPKVGAQWTRARETAA